MILYVASLSIQKLQSSYQRYVAPSYMVSVSRTVCDTLCLARQCLVDCDGCIVVNSHCLLEFPKVAMSEYHQRVVLITLKTCCLRLALKLIAESLKPRGI